MIKMVISLINAKTLIPVFIIFGLLVIPVTNAYSQAIIPQSFFLEDPFADTDVQARGEWINIKGDAGGGSLWMNQFRADINIYENLLGVYVKVPFAGVSGNSALDGDYDIGNVGVGGKAALISTDQYILTAGFEGIIPTTSNGDGAAAARSYFRDFVYFVDDAWTLKPYGIFAAGNGQIGFQANIDGDIVLDADSIEGSSTEFLLKYGGTVSYTPELNTPFATSLLVEVLGVSSTSFNDNITGGYVTPGIRVGGQTVSMGAGVEIPFGSDEVSDFADIGVVLDLIFRFGS
ncbi:MAG: hypothetical protein ACR2NW_00040 [Thermodesulfobacteriota bacterium]